MGVSLIKLGTLFHQDIPKKVKKTSYKPRPVIRHTHSWQRIRVKNTYRRRKTRLTEHRQALPRKSSVITVSHRMCLCSQHQLVIEWDFLNIKWKLLLVLTQRYKALSFASSEISQESLLLPPCQLQTSSESRKGFHRSKNLKPRYPPRWLPRTHRP